MQISSAALFLIDSGLCFPNPTNSVFTIDIIVKGLFFLLKIIEY